MKKTCISVFCIIISFLFIDFEVQAKEYKVLLNEDIGKYDREAFLEKYNLKLDPIDYYIINVKDEKELKNIRGIAEIISNEDLCFVKPYTPTSLNHKHNIKELKRSNTPDISDGLWDKQWDIKKVTNNGRSFSKHKPSSVTTVAIIDSGIDENHIEFKGTLKNGSRNFVPKGGYNGKESEEDGDQNNIQDKTGHGTAVASQISSNKNIRGVAPGLKLRMYRVFGQKSAKVDWITKAIIQAANDDNDVINLSAGQYLMKNGKFINGKNDNISIQAYNRAINYAWKKGTVVVGSLGNDGINVNSQHQMSKHLSKIISPTDAIVEEGEIYDYPSQNKKVVSVGGTDYNNNISNFSNYGKNSFDILAPAGSTKNLNKFGLEKFKEDKYYEKDWIFVATPNDTYQYLYGNSFATPKVSATLALIIDKYHYKDQPKKSLKHLLKYNKKYLNVDSSLSDSYAIAN